MELKIARMDESKVNDGVWTNFLGVQLCVAKAGSTKFVAAYKKNVLALGKEEHRLRPEEKDEALYKTMAQTVLLDWSGFVIEGAEVAYSVDNAYNLLKSDADTRNFVSAFSMNLANFLEAKERELGEE